MMIMMTILNDAGTARGPATSTRKQRKSAQRLRDDEVTKIMVKYGEYEGAGVYDSLRWRRGRAPIARLQSHAPNGPTMVVLVI